ncbi:hypothetical protein Tsubulata_050382, partial [Turnera subulata]
MPLPPTAGEGKAPLASTYAPPQSSPAPSSSASPEINMSTVDVRPQGTFKDKLLLGNQPTAQETRSEFVEQEGDIVSFLTPEGPVVKISDRYRAMLHKRWENTLIVKLWGRNIGYKTLCSRLPNLWNLKESVRVVDLENNFYFVRFLNRYDYLHALTDGPWTVFDHYLTVEPWKPQFNPTSHKVTSIVAWIQIPGLSSEYYDRGILRAVCNEIGRLVRLDHNTEDALRGRYARVAVELDLSQPLQSQVFVDGIWYFISYENIPQICFECGFVGHLPSACPSRTAANVQQVEAQETGQEVNVQGTHCAPTPSRLQPSARPLRGEWMIASRRRRPPRTPGGAPTNKETGSGKEVSSNPISGSRFDILQDYVTVERPQSSRKGKASVN